MPVALPEKQIEDFCRRWHINELALFGSVLRDDFRADSDIDVLITLSPEAPRSLDNRLHMQDELTEIFGRRIDLVEKRNLRNPFIRHAILSTKKVIYAG